TTWQDYEMLEIRVYFGQHFAIHVDPALNSLQVPQFQRNLLISPPGSPFDGWEQIAEDPPNQAVLGSDLMAAAEVSDYELDQDELQLEMKKKSLSTPSRFNIVCSKGTEQPEHLPSITVEDWDG
ncbi:Calcipressin-domain-containing protein, partial [Thamnidium elegans]